MIYEEESSFKDSNFNKYLLILKIFLSLLILLYNNKIKDTNKVELDNEIRSSTFENNTEFPNFGNEINIFSIYYLEYTFSNIMFNNSMQFLYNFINSDNIKNQFKNIDLPLNKLNKYIKTKIKLAKSHGITGFGIIYYFLERNEISNKIMDIFAENKDYPFPFFLIFKSQNFGENKFN